MLMKLDILSYIEMRSNSATSGLLKSGSTFMKISLKMISTGLNSKPMNLQAGSLSLEKR